MSVKFLPSNGFRSDIESEVEAYFRESGLSPRDVPRMYAKTAFLFMWLAASYVGLVFFADAWWNAVPVAMSLGLAMAGIGFSVQHDGGHGAYSDVPLVNRIMACTLDFLGGSSYFWRYKHNIAHHTYPNISGLDDDLEVGTLARLSPHVRSYPFHRFQHFYMWLLYSLMVVRWHFIDDFHSMIDPGIGKTHVPRPRGLDQVRFWVGKTVFFGLVFGVPLLFHPFWSVAVCYLIVAATLGLTLGTTFQLAHCVGEADFPSPHQVRIERDWATHQLDTTVDFARDNRFVTWFVGGLNFQIEHHLFPQICHVHYPAVSRIVERVSARHGIRYRCNDKLSDALHSHYRWLRQMGRPTETA